jgi:hypothetical protein
MISQPQKSHHRSPTRTSEFAVPSSGGSPSVLPQQGQAVLGT